MSEVTVILRGVILLAGQLAKTLTPHKKDSKLGKRWCTSQIKREATNEINEEEE